MATPSNKSNPQSNQPDPQDQQPKTKAEQDLAEFIAAIGSVLKIAQLQSTLGQDSRMYQMLGPQMFAGLQAALYGKGQELLRHTMGTGNMDYLKSVTGPGQSAPSAMANVQQVAEGQAKANEMYQKAQTQAASQHTSLPSYMQDQSGLMKLPYYVQQNLLGSSQYNPMATPEFDASKLSAQQKAQMYSAQREMTPAQQKRMDRMMGPQEEK